jgi:hypothetical protein
MMGWLFCNFTKLETSNPLFSKVVMIMVCLFIYTNLRFVVSPNFCKN